MRRGNCAVSSGGCVGPGFDFGRSEMIKDTRLYTQSRFRVVVLLGTGCDFHQIDLKFPGIS